MRIFFTILMGLCFLQSSSAKRLFHSSDQSLTVQVDKIENVSCHGGSNGAIYLTVQGKAPFIFKWSNGHDGQNLTDVPAGAYSCTVIDADSETVSLEDLNVGQPAAPLTVPLAFIQHINCLSPFGSLTVKGEGGTGPYVYKWSNGDTGPTASPLPAGTFTVTVTDVKNCFATKSATITQNLTPPTANAGPAVPVLCSNSVIQLQGTGSTGPQFTQQWTSPNGGMFVTGANTLQPTVNHTATYVLTITNTTNGCTASDATTVSSVYQSPAVVLNGGTLNCANSSIKLIATIDTLHTTFFWQGPNNFSSPILQPTVSTTGNYLLTVTDTITSCFTIATATVALDTIHPTATASVSGTISCASPSVFLLAWSNVGNANFYWTGPNNFTGSGVQVSVGQPGVYTLTATNPQNGCSVIKTITVMGSTAAPTVSATVSGPITCTVPSVVLTGNVQPTGMNILWTGPNGFLSNNLIVSVSTPGVYTLRATNTQNGCTASVSVTVIENKQLPDLNVITGTITCSTPTVTIYANTNTPGLTFKWTGPNGYSSTVQNPVVNVGGFYTVTATNPVNGCTKMVSISVNTNLTKPSVLTADGTISCAIPIGKPTASSTTPGATFFWTGPGGYTATGGNPSVTLPGFYTVVATNPANGCTIAVSVQVHDKTQLPIAYAGDPQELNCMNSPILLSGFGSSSIGSFSYLWTTFDGNILTGATSLFPRINAIGTYTLKVTNNQTGCMAFDSVEVSQAPAVTIAMGQTTHVACFGTATGSATSIAYGGSGSYTYGWSNGSTTATAGGLSAGWYTVTISDSEGCTNVGQVLINQPTALQVNTSATPQTAFGVNNGTATVTFSGGTSPYSVKWSTGQSTSVISNLAPGTYTVTVTDSKGCTAVRTAQVNAVNCNLTGSIAATSITCSGMTNGTATANINGGANPLLYYWSNGGQIKTISNLNAATYTVTVVDAAGCTLVLNTQITSPAPVVLNFVAKENVLCPSSKDGLLTVGVTGGTSPYTYTWSNGANSSTASNLGPGTYTVTVTDSKTCTKSLSSAISITDQNPPQLILKNASASLNAGGMAVVAPAMFDNGSFDAECSIASWTVTPTNFNCSQLGARTVTLTATDVNGNSKTGTATVTITDNIAPTLSCPANIFAGACAAVVQFSFPQVSDNCSINQNQIQQTSGLPSGSNFPAGKTLQVFSCTDAGGNTAICSFEVWITEAPSGSITPIPASCSGICDGSAVFIPNGVMPETILWNNGQNGSVASGYCSGMQSVTIVDIYGCSAQLPFNIPSANNGSFEIFNTTTPATCDNSCNGYSDVQVAGGMPPFQISWSNGQSGPSAINLCPGAYSATVTDGNGCSQVAPVQVSAVDNIAPTLLCPGNKTTSYCSPIVSFSPPQVQDNCTVDLQRLEQLGGLPSGAAFPQGVTVQSFYYSDAAGNDAYCNFTVTVLQAAGLTLSAEDVSCAGRCDGMAILVPSGGFGPYNIQWSNGQQGTTAFNLCPGTFGVTISDAAGCSQTRQLTISQPLPLSLAVLQVAHDVGNAGIGKIQIDVDGGTQPYTYAWFKNAQPFDDTPNLSQLQAGQYQLFVTDAMGCAISSAVINISNTVAAQEAGWATDLRLQPNPAQDFVQIYLPENLGREVEIRLISPGGALVRRERISVHDSAVQLDLNTLPAGLWLVHVRLDDGRETVRKLFIQR